MKWMNGDSKKRFVHQNKPNERETEREREYTSHCMCMIIQYTCKEEKTLEKNKFDFVDVILKLVKKR